MSSWRPKKKTVIEGAVTLAVLGAGVATFLLLQSSASPPATAEGPPAPITVSAETVTRHDADVSIRAHGSVRYADRAILRAQVSGRIDEVSEALEPGAQVEEGQRLLEIDPRDYRLALAARRGDVASAEVELRRQRNQRAVAEDSWERLAPDLEGERDRSFALRGPQLEAAEAQLAAARSGLAQARLNVERTRVKAPLRAVVSEVQVDHGDYVTPRDPIATLIGVDRYWVIATVRLRELARISFPAAATIRLEAGDEIVDRDATATRALQALSEQGSLARVLVEVPEPLGQDGDVPLLLGAFVDVTVEAAPLEDVIEVPRRAVHEGGHVWVVDDGRLRSEEVDVVWSESGRSFVQTDSDLDGAKVVTSTSSDLAEGMRVNVREEERAEAPGRATRRDGSTATVASRGDQER